MTGEALMTYVSWLAMMVLSGCTRVSPPEAVVVTQENPPQAVKKTAPPAAPEVVYDPLVLPLAVGSRWDWVEEMRTGAGLRVFGQTQAPATTEALGRRSLEIVSRDEASGRFEARVTIAPVDGEMTEARYTVWNDAAGTWMLDAAGQPTLALVAEVPPDPLSVETLSCDMPLLHVKGGFCAARAGGPEGRAPGVLGLRFSSGGSLKGLGQVLVGVATLGTFIPGNRTPVHVMELERFEPGEGTPTPRPRPSPFVTAVERGGAFLTVDDFAPIVGAHTPELEELALGLMRISRADTVQALLPFALVSSLEQDRPQLLRALVRGRMGSDALGMLVAAKPFLPLPLSAAHEAALVDAMPAHPTLVRALLTEDLPVVEAWLAAGEGDADADQLAAACAAGHPDERQRQLMLSMLLFDKGRLTALKVFLEGAPAEDATSVFLQAYRTLGFDKGRLQAVDAHAALVAGFSDTAKRELLQGVIFEKEAMATRLGVTVD